MTDSRAGAGCGQDKPGIPVQSEDALRTAGSGGDDRVRLAGAAGAKEGTLRASERILITTY